MIKLVSCFWFLISGFWSFAFTSQQPASSIQHPATSNQQPATSIQLPFPEEQTIFHTKNKPGKKDVQSIREIDKPPNWVFYLILILGLFYIYIKVKFWQDITELFRSLFNINIAKQLSRKHELSLLSSAGLLNINFFLVLSLYFYFIATYYNWGLPSPTQASGQVNGAELLLFFPVYIAPLLLAKYMLLKIAAKIFPFKEEANFYNFNILLVYKVLGIVLFPFLVLIPFGLFVDVVVWIMSSLVLAILLFVYRYVKGFIISKNYLLFHKYHFFVYICTLEIAPAIVLFKIIF